LLNNGNNVTMTNIYLSLWQRHVLGKRFIHLHFYYITVWADSARYLHICQCHEDSLGNNAFTSIRPQSQTI